MGIDRREEKQAARDEDRRLVETGATSVLDLAERNEFFSSLDVARWRIVSIGGRAPS